MPKKCDPPDVHALQPSDVRGLCRICLRRLEDVPEGSWSDDRMSQLYNQITGDTLLTSELHPIDAGWCYCCVLQMRQAAKTVAKCRRSNMFWSEYLKSAKHLATAAAAAAAEVKVKDEFEMVNLKVEVEPSDITVIHRDPVDIKVNIDEDDNNSQHSFDNAADDDNDDEDHKSRTYEPCKPLLPARRTKSRNQHTKTLPLDKTTNTTTTTTTPNKRQQRQPPDGGQVCHICGLVYHKMERHMISAHSELTCDMCARTFNHKVLLRRHFRDDHGFQRYTCETCQRPNLTLSVWTRHQDMHRPKKERIFACEHCGNSYPTLHNLRQHVARVHVHKEVTCPECGKLFHNAIRLRDHMIRHRPRTLTCPEPGCPRMFWLVKDQKEHCRTVHEKNRKYVCEVCGKAFLVNAQLKKHHSLGRCRGAPVASAGTAPPGRGRPQAMQAPQQQQQEIHFGEEPQVQHQPSFFESGADVS